MNSSPADMLEKMPKKTPSWAVGMSVVFIAIATSLISMYVVSRTEVVRLLDSKIESHEEIQQAGIQERDKMISSILNLVSDNSSQITGLTKALLETQQANNELSQRVARIEKELASSRVLLDSCETKLKKCEGK